MKVLTNVWGQTAQCTTPGILLSFLVSFTMLLCGAERVWRAVVEALEGNSPTAAENAATAAAALCQVLPAGSHDLVSEVVQKLQRGSESQ